jgi:hypothetical protein
MNFPFYTAEGGLPRRPVRRNFNEDGSPGEGGFASIARSAFKIMCMDFSSAFEPGDCGPVLKPIFLYSLTAFVLSGYTFKEK